MAQTGVIRTVRGPVDVVRARSFAMPQERGVAQEELDIMTIQNPRRVLAW
jgi:predicted metal-dependent phosphotriesterase family hydrolase